MTNSDELPQISSTWRDKKPYADHYFRGEQKTDAWPLRESLFEVIAGEVGKTQMTLDNIVRAIGRGVGEPLVLTLQELAKHSKSAEQMRSVLPLEVYGAILRYKKST